MRKILISLCVLCGTIPAFADGVHSLGLHFGAPTVNGSANVSDPSAGDIIFDTSSSNFYGYDGVSAWIPFGGLTSGAQTISGVKTFENGAIIAGVTDGSTAAAGYVGELVSSQPPSNVTPTASGSWETVTSVTLAPGSWADLSTQSFIV